MKLIDENTIAAATLEPLNVDTFWDIDRESVYYRAS